MAVFEEYITNKETRRLYTESFERFLRHFNLTDPSYLLTQSKEETFDILKKYILFQRQRAEQGQIKAVSIRISLAGIVHFYTYNDVVVNWKKLYKLIPQNTKAGGDKAYSKEQLQAMLNGTYKMRNRFLVLFMASTGARVGALHELKLKHLSPIEDCHYVVLYNDEKEEYVSFTTPECSRLYEQYLQTRRNEGEVLTQESPLFRHDYDKGKKDNLSIGRQIIYDVISRMVNNSGINRTKKGNRFDIPIVHGLRKFFATQVKGNPSISYSTSERLLGHAGYLEKSYFLPDLQKLFTEYRKVIPSLTVDQTFVQKEEIRQLRAQKNEMDKMKEENEMLSDKIERQEQILSNVLSELERLKTQNMS